MPSQDPDLYFELLGPLTVRVAGRVVPIRSPKQRILLAVLLLNAGRPVPITELAEAIWGISQPESPRRTVQLCVTRLRTLLDEAGCAPMIVTGTNSYSIDVPADGIDLGRFQHWLQEADRAAERSDPEKESVALADALLLWRGAPLADVPSELLHREVVPHLREQRLRTVERRIDVQLRRGRHLDVVGELMELTAQEPLRERFWAQLMTALHRGGRRADALAAYHAGRRHLAEELGIDPGEDLRQLHAAILSGPAAGGAGSVPLPTVPRQLPPEVATFVGRAREVARLAELLGGREGGAPSDPATTVIISGTAGVGKTALALHWARRAADRFPDGQLWVNLRGYDPGPTMTPDRALTLFLRALGVPDREIPPDLDSRAALYRSLMDGRRTLVVLDNVRAAEQIRPLLPGGPGNAVLVTSRDRLTGLSVTDGAHPLMLGLLSADEARELLARRLGADRVDVESDAAREIVQRCDRLPLALAIVAARAAERPGFPLDTLARQLRSERDRLDGLSLPDAAADVRATFRWSYRTLGEASARLFRLLGIHPGPDFSAASLASLAGVPPARVRPLLAELAGTHLITEYVDGRYGTHDLLRAYATELVHAVEEEAERDAALRRVLDHYLHTAHAAALLIEPLRDPIVLEVPDPGVVLEPPDDHEQALNWFNTEYPALLASIERAAELGLDVRTWKLVWTLADFQQWRGHWADRAAALRAALEATRRLNNRAEQARAHRGLGYAHTRLARYDEAHHHLRYALGLYRGLRDTVGQVRAHLGLSYVLERQGKPDGALWHARRALALYPADGNRAHRARALNAVGWCHARLGEHREALQHCEQALALLREHRDRVAEAANWDTLGYTHHHLGDHRQAISCYQAALRLRRDLGHRYGEANTLTHLGDTYQMVGDQEAAQHAWHDALSLFEQLGEPDADRVRAKLGRLAGASAA